MLASWSVVDPACSMATATISAPRMNEPTLAPHYHNLWVVTTIRDPPKELLPIHTRRREKPTPERPPQTAAARIASAMVSSSARLGSLLYVEGKVNPKPSFGYRGITWTWKCGMS